MTSGRITTLLAATVMVLVTSLATTVGAAPGLVATRVVLPAASNGLYQGYLPNMACVSVGNCVVSGVYNDTNGDQQGLVDVETKGVWQTSLALTPPTGAVNTSGGITMYSISCGSLANCATVGTYITGSGNQLPFVSSEVGGPWGHGTALVLPTNAATSGQVATPHAISCTGPGNCSVAGTYLVATTGASEGFVSSEIHGTWRTAVEVALPAGHNANPFVTLNQLACWKAGYCEGVGTYTDNTGVTHAFVVAQVKSAWHPAQGVSLPNNANAYADATLSEVTCLAGGDCTAVGTYLNIHGVQIPFAVSALAQVWRRGVAITMPAGAATNPSTVLYGFRGVSCATAGTCAFGGQYLDSAGNYQGFLVNRIKGVWQAATELALPAGARYAGHNGGVVAVSCTTAGHCSAAAAYVNAGGNYQTMLVSESGFAWSPGVTVTLPGTASTVGVDGGIYSVQCFTPATCQIEGSYLVGSSDYEGFVAAS